jgi:hypothetical protein
MFMFLPKSYSLLLMVEVILLLVLSSDAFVVNGFSAGVSHKIYHKSSTFNKIDRRKTTTTTTKPTFVRMTATNDNKEEEEQAETGPPPKNKSGGFISESQQQHLDKFGANPEIVGEIVFDKLAATPDFLTNLMPGKWKSLVSNMKEMKQEKATTQQLQKQKQLEMEKEREKRKLAFQQKHGTKNDGGVSSGG